LAACGAKRGYAQRFKHGDEVYAKASEADCTIRGNIALAESDVALKPERFTVEEVHCTALVAMTAWALVEERELRAGQTVRDSTPARRPRDGRH